MSNLSWCIMGSGYIAKEWIIAIKMMNYNSIAIVGRNPSTVCELAKSFSVTGVVGLQNKSTNKLIGNADVIIVATSIESTRQTIEAALKSKKDGSVIICEKPGYDFQESIGDAILNSSYEHPDVYIAYNRRFYSNMNLARVELRKLVDSSYDIICKAGISENFAEIDVNKFSMNVADGWVLANTIHVIDMLNYLLSTVGCDLYKQLGGLSIDWGCRNSFRLEMKSGRVLQLELECHTHRPGWYISFFGGGTQISFAPLERLKIVDSKGSREISEASQIKPGYLNMVKAINCGDFEKFEASQSNIRKLQMVDMIFNTYCGHRAR
ncbi:Gfo/Idh/MocA family oxidoreductase [Alphaproteobacteria bacterium]|nr:Gfo/Idh/MocA family oxidoreductase [Alphaproteobacteria bacterium]